MTETERRRRRFRDTGHEAAKPECEETTSGDTNRSGSPPRDAARRAGGAETPTPRTQAGRRRTGPPTEDRDGDRGLRGLVGSGASQVSVSAAMRARDAARPTDEELAHAEQRVTVVRRNWAPRDETPPGRR